MTSPVIPIPISVPSAFRYRPYAGLSAALGLAACCLFAAPASVRAQSPSGGLKALDAASELRVSKDLPETKAAALRKSLFEGEETCGEEECDWEREDVYLDKQGQLIALPMRVVRDAFREAKAEKNPARQKAVLARLKSQFRSKVLTKAEEEGNKLQMEAMKAQARKEGKK